MRVDLPLTPMTVIPGSVPVRNLTAFEIERESPFELSSDTAQLAIAPTAKNGAIHILFL